MPRNEPSHRKTGAALGFDGDVIDVSMRCTGCQTLQTEPVDACAKAREAIAAVVCLFCGRAGAMRMVRT